MSVLGAIDMSAQCISKIWSGDQHFVAIYQNGTLRAWGDNYWGQLGNGTTTHNPNPTTANYDTDWMLATAGRKHNLALKTNGTLWAWGSDENEALGNGTAGQYLVPTQIGTDTDWKAIAAGEGFSLAIKTNGTLWAWGTNTNRCFGNGASTVTTYNVPTQIGTQTDWKEISGCGQYVLAIKDNGTLWAWGNNDYGQLGIGNTITQGTPVQVGTATDWKWIDTTLSAGAPISIAMKTNNTIWLWGHDTVLEISSNTPSQLGTASDWKTISVRKNYSARYVMLTKQNGTLWAWGKDNYEQLGNLWNNNYTVPTQIGNGTNWVTATAGNYESNGITTDGQFWAWGFTSLVHNNGTAYTDAPTAYNCTPTLEIDDFETASGFKIYPNPTSGIIHFSREIDADIYDITGKKVMTLANAVTANLSALVQGIYIVKTLQGASQKLIVQ
ncbi:T9SS type A sorting domain-containing protein [Flavobacterium lindanitolerans]|uniref:RCC1 domain-containing protein n=1 Tax=Flavobacterium lindanitolerans TaxID=428988 RepID=UPI0031B2B260